jgi:hypothetical protein
MCKGLVSIIALLALAGGALASPAAAQPTGDEPISTAAERANRTAGNQLLSLIPSSYEARCRIHTDEDVATDPLLGAFADRIEAFVYCLTPDNTTNVHAIRFDDVDAVDALYEAYTPGGLAGQAPECATDGTWNEGQGRHKCFIGGTVAQYAWTFPAENTVFLASRGDGDMAALTAFWESDEAPPVGDAEVQPIVTDAQWRSNGRLLRKSVPKDIRGSCELAGVSTDGLGGLHRDRLHMRAALGCSPGNGLGVQYASFDRPDSAQAFIDFVALGADEDTPRAEAGGVECEGTGTWSRRSRTVGDYACLYDVAGPGSIGMSWVDRTQSVAVVVNHVDGDLDATIQFFEDGGPLANKALARRAG